MHLLYLDDAGSVTDVAQEYYVLGGFSLFERQPHWVSKRLDEIAGRFGADHSEIELHGNPMLRGSGKWRKIPRADREQAYKDALSVLPNHGHSRARAFVAVIRKEAASPNDPVEMAFEQVANRFDRMLLRFHRQGDTQRGLMILDKSVKETRLQSLAVEFKEVGHRWGNLTNQAEAPVFVDSRATRLIQLADLIAHAAYQNWARGNSQYFDLVRPQLDSEGGITHGLFTLL